MIEKVNPIVPVYTDYENDTDIFEKCNFDVDIFLEKYPETRCLSKQEIIAIHSYCETGKKYDFANDTILGSGRSSGYSCIFKIEDGRWIVWKTDEKRGFYSAKAFATTIEACYYLLSLQKNVNENQCKDYFNNLLDNGMLTEEMIEFSQNFNYSISNSKFKKYGETDDSGTIASTLSEFEYDSTQTEEVLKKHESLKECDDNLKENKNPHKITSVAKAISMAVRNKDFSKKSAILMKKIFGEESINSNPLKNIPNYEMRLYFINGNYFEFMDDAINYCRANNMSKKRLIILDYFREFAGFSDVIRRKDCNTEKFFSVVNEDNFCVYNNEKSICCGEFIWENKDGNIREMYEPFRKNGIVFEDDIYLKQDKKMQRILSLCKETSNRKK